MLNLPLLHAMDIIVKNNYSDKSNDEIGDNSDTQRNENLIEKPEKLHRVADSK